MAATRQKFDGLSDDYDRYRPRYPEALIERIVEWLPPRDGLRVVDAGAGTGIALDALVPVRGPAARYEAVDLSDDMVQQGRRKHPYAEWAVGAAEPYLETAGTVDLVVAAQSYQWMDRPRFLAAAAAALGADGVLAIMQNNRDATASAFLDAYESLLEAMSPGYSRDYRSFDIADEVASVFARTAVHVVTWARRMTKDAFAGMVNSSTQAQRAVAAHGDSFFRELRALLDQFAPTDEIDVPYRSELFLGKERRP